MKLHSVATHFDQTKCFDAYDGAYVFSAQFDLYDDSKRDGLSAQRRVISIKPETELPPRGVIQVDRDFWVVGERQTDYFRGSAIRDKYIVQKADSDAEVMSVADYLNDVATTPIYVGRQWVKSSKQVDTSSEIFPEYEYYLHLSETASVGQLIIYAGGVYIIEDVLETSGGFLGVMTEQVAGATEVPATATWSTKVYSAATDTYTETPTTIPVLEVRWQTYFKYEQNLVNKFKHGDTVVLVTKADMVTVKPGDHFTLGGKKKIIVASIDAEDCWALHVQNAG